MAVDIFLTAQSTKRKIQFPSLPKEIKIKHSTQYQSYTILDLREVAFPNGTTPCEVSWEGVFYGPPRKDFSWLIRKWTEPKTMYNTLLDWYKKGEVIKLVVADTPINVDVTIESFECVPAGGFGDYAYSISFLESNNDEIVITKTSTSSGGSSGGSSSGGSSSSGRTHKVRSGDTLWGISQKYYKAGSKYMTIYNANKSIIESTAKKHGYKSSKSGHWIFPGTVLTIP